MVKFFFSKNVNNKKCAPKMIFFNENFFQKVSDNFLHRKLTLKVKNWHFWSADFRVFVRDMKLRVIFYQWQKVGLGLDVEAEIQILKVI